MRRLFSIYILVLLALGVACQRVDLPDNPQVNQPAELPVGEIGSKVTIAFSTADVTGPETRGIVNNKVEVETLHLIVFDENGMLVEVCKAEEHDSSDHVDTETGEVHKGGRHYSVKLTVTDKPRIIHYVANCDVDQVVYGHETSVIGNMFVDRNDSEDPQTDYEVSYWARIWVPYILVEEKEETQADGTIKKVLSLVGDIEDEFMHVPLLRNYAEITVTDDVENKDDTFKIEGFIVYNLLNRGTVAPYNSNTQQFQSFFDKDSNGIITNYSYPDMLDEGYEGHALTSAQLITDLVRNPDGTIKEFKPGEPFYVYERKVSVMTDEEEKWRESPPHIIIKARYSDDKDAVKDTDPIYYYKMDLVYTEEDALGTEEVKYYNILRNFMYDFNISKIHDVGYSSWEEAAAGAAGNNISGSTTTSKLTNVSDDKGRLWVSYTDITLVTGDDVVFRYKYIPNYYGTPGSEYVHGAVRNDLVRLAYDENGDVITDYDVAENDASDGWREVTIQVNKPSEIIRQQILYLKTDNSNLNRQIRHTLRKKLTMQVECTPKVYRAIKEKVQVDIKLPIGMTEDMFPLELNMETENRTLSPDATKNTIPVNTGLSIIDGRREQQSYYYTVTIPTYDEYRALPNDGNMKVYSTYWLTNMAENASTFYVDNKYFNLASDSWQNYEYEFSGVSCSPSAVGVGSDVTINFTMANGAVNKQVTIALEGMTYSGTQDGVTYTDAKTFKYTPKSKDVTISEGLRTTTATDAVSFTLDADGYNIASAEGDRLKYKFNGAFGVPSLKAEADVEVDFTFEISEKAFTALNSLYDAGDAGVPMFVTLDRLQPADDKLVYSQAKAGGDRYIYRIKQSGTQTIKLATTEAAVGDCIVTLEADYFDTETKEIKQVGREFRSLNITNNRIAQGLGRSVNITFQLAADEGNNAQKDVTVTLVNMAVNGNDTITFNTGDNNAVTNNNGTYTIKNVVTAGDPAGELKVMITAKGYSSREATFTKERPVPKFTASLNKTNLGANADEEVVLSFSSQDLVDGMAVTLELDGLRPKDNLPTRAVTRYVYTVNGTGQQNIPLVTTESTATSKTCSVQLKAEDFGFEDSQILSVVQSNIVTYAGTINITNANLSFNQLQTDDRHSSSATYSITVNGNKVVTDQEVTSYTTENTQTGNWWNYQYYITRINSFKIENVSISGADISGDTNVKIEITITANNNDRTVTYSSTIDKLGLKLK